MKIAYATRTGNVESIVNNLGYDDALRIDDGSETIEEEYVLFTYTDGFGDIPMEVESFLEGNADFLQGVVVSGDKGYGEAYCLSGDKIAEMYNVDVLYRVENDGTDDDLAAIEAKLAEL